MKGSTHFPSYEVLAQYSKCCVRKVKSIIKKLEEMALIAVHRRGRDRKNAHASNVYVLPTMVQTKAADTQPLSSDQLFSLDRIPAIKQKQADIIRADFQQKNDEPENEAASSAPYAPPCADHAPPHAPDAHPRAHHAPNKELFNNNICRNSSVNHSFFEGEDDGEQAAKAEAIAQLLDDHFDYVGNFSIQDINTRAAYFSLRTYITEMLLAPQTRLSGGVTEFQFHISVLIFTADGNTLHDFIRKVWRNRDGDPIVSPRAYAKKALLEYLRADSLNHQLDYFDLNDGKISPDDARADLSFHRYTCILNGIEPQLIEC